MSPPLYSKCVSILTGTINVSTIYLILSASSHSKSWRLPLFGVDDGPSHIVPDFHLAIHKQV